MVELAGPRYQRKAADLPLRRWGSQLGSVYLALLLDGKSFADEQIIIALGVTLDGQKIPLGFVQAATENERVCRRFLGDLVDGLQYEDGLLVVIDGANGLYKADSTVTIVSLLDRNVSSLDHSGIAYTVSTSRINLSHTGVFYTDLCKFEV